MNKTRKIIMTFLAADALLIAVYFGIKTLSSGDGETPMTAYEWTMMDADYVPRHEVEAILKNNAEERDLFPLYFRDYGRNNGVLKRFKGSHFAKPSEAVLEFTLRGLDDWKIVDIKYRNEKGMEISRSLLCVSVKGTWRAEDSGPPIC